ncbi:MAG: hypothetical protein P8Y42_18740 [Exilibacterium sp.]
MRARRPKNAYAKPTRTYLPACLGQLPPGGPGSKAQIPRVIEKLHTASQ